MGDFIATQVFIKMAFTSTTTTQKNVITWSWRAVAWG